MTIIMIWIINFLEFLNKNQGFLSFLSTILWGVYVYYTIKTFIQIKRQTDLQMDANLLIESQMGDNQSAMLRCPSESIQLHNKWSEIIKRLPRGSELSDRRQCLELKLRNRGKSDIIKWQIKVTAQINPSTCLQENYNTTSETSEWIVSSRDASNYICAGEDIKVLIAVTGMYPKAQFSWTIKYLDSRGKTYNIFAGDSEKIDENLLVNMLRSDAS